LDVRPSFTARQTNSKIPPKEFYETRPVFFKKAAELQAAKLDTEAELSPASVVLISPPVCAGGVFLSVVQLKHATPIIR
jgi:hypothetical protein